MAKPDTWMPLYIGDYLADTMHLQAEQHGAYMLLLMAAWMRGGELPDDDGQLALLARCDAKAWKRLRPVIAPFFKVEGGTWRQKRVTKELWRANDNAAKAEEKARRAAEARWERERAAHAASNAPSTAPSNAASNAPSMPQAMLEQCPPPPPPPVPSEQRSRSKDGADAPEVNAWTYGIDLLKGGGLSEREARSYIAALCKTWPEATVLDALMAATGKAEPKAYARKYLADKPKKGDPKALQQAPLAAWRAGANTV